MRTEMTKQLFHKKMTCKPQSLQRNFFSGKDQFAHLLNDRTLSDKILVITVYPYNLAVFWLVSPFLHTGYLETTLSNDFLNPPIFLNALGVSPVSFLNWDDKWATLLYPSFQAISLRESSS